MKKIFIVINVMSIFSCPIQSYATDDNNFKDSSLQATTGKDRHKYNYEESIFTMDDFQDEPSEGAGRNANTVSFNLSKLDLNDDERDQEEGSEDEEAFSQSLRIYSPLKEYKGDTLVFRTEEVDMEDEDLPESQAECFRTAYNIQVLDEVYNICSPNADVGIKTTLNDEEFLNYIENTPGVACFKKVMFEGALFHHYNLERLHKAVFNNLLQPGGIYVLPIHAPDDLQGNYNQYKNTPCWPAYVTDQSFKVENEIANYYWQTVKYFSSFGFSRIELSYSWRDFDRNEQGIPVRGTEEPFTEEELAQLDPEIEDYAPELQELIERERDPRMAGIKRSDVFLVLTK